MTRPKPPRLPELAGMTEAGFNRVVAMIQPDDFRACRAYWSPEDARLAALECEAWRASLPKVRNKKQRKADAKREALRSPGEFVAVCPIGVWEQTPFQRLQQFAAKNGEPVSFEIAEKAMKGGW